MYTRRMSGQKCGDCGELVSDDIDEKTWSECPFCGGTNLGIFFRQVTKTTRNYR